MAKKFYEVQSHIMLRGAPRRICTLRPWGRDRLAESVAHRIRPTTRGSQSVSSGMSVMAHGGADGELTCTSAFESLAPCD
jgi:hypothetical protein